MLMYLLAEIVHTSDIESINNLQLKYAPKMTSYGWISMIVRASVCAIDWNWNVGRIQKVDEAGNLLYREKVNIR